jgi:hypothetical protein
MWRQEESDGLKVAFPPRSDYHLEGTIFGTWIPPAAGSVPGLNIGYPTHNK